MLVEPPKARPGNRDFADFPWTHGCTVFPMENGEAGKARITSYALVREIPGTPAHVGGLPGPT
jgi:hypothetical protein